MGAIIRDHKDRVVGALMRRWSSILDPLIAEYLAIREGLRVVYDRGLQIQCVESGRDLNASQRLIKFSFGLILI